MGTWYYQDYPIIRQLLVYEKDNLSYTHIARCGVYVSQGHDEFACGEALTDNGLPLPGILMFKEYSN